VTFYGLAAPKGTPPEIVDRLNKEINRLFKDPDIRARLETTEPSSAAAPSRSSPNSSQGISQGSTGS